MDIAGHLFDGIAHFDETFYDSLARMVNEEPVQSHDLVAMAQLRSIGIERGKRFEPSAAVTELLSEAIIEARAGFIQSTMALPSLWPSSRWAIPASGTGSKTAYTFIEDDRLDVDAPAKQFWAVSVYDLESEAFIRNAPRVELSSYDRNVQKNEDGSVDVWFGRAAPEGKESNWIATTPGKDWLTMFRLYGPDTAVLEKSWRLADLEPL